MSNSECHTFKEEPELLQMKKTGNKARHSQIYLFIYI